MALAMALCIYQCKILRLLLTTDDLVCVKAAGLRL